jgi:hypothetical protein
VCNVSFIVYVALCAVFCFSMVFVFCVLCIIAVPLPPGGKTHFQLIKIITVSGV